MLHRSSQADFEASRNNRSGQRSNPAPFAEVPPKTSVFLLTLRPAVRLRFGTDTSVILSALHSNGLVVSSIRGFRPLPTVCTAPQARRATFGAGGQLRRSRHRGRMAVLRP
jgi:hypothetical protein